jgi:putative ABC transport system permease protein
MWKATLKGIVAHRVRLVLSMVAVMLGVAFVAGTYVLTDTLRRSYDGLFSQTVANVDVVVRLRGEDGPELSRERFSEQLLPRVQSVSGVDDAYGVIYGYAQFVDRHGDAVRSGPLSLGLSWSQPGRDGPLRLVGPESHAPSGPNEVAMDVHTAQKEGFAVGDRVRVLLTGPAQEFEIAGLFGFGDRVDLGAFTAAAFDLETAQQAFGAPGQIDQINVIAASDTDVRALRARIAEVVGPNYDVQLADDAADDSGVAVRDLLNLLSALLLGFAGIGVVVAAFLVFNTFTIVVAQRTRELGLLRVIGASRGQMVTALLLEALVVGVVASLVGLALGVLVASGLLAAVEGIGFDIPEGGIVVAPRTVVVALGVGVVVTVAAALWPAIRASREAPVDALADAVRMRQPRLRRRTIIGAVVLLAAVPFLVAGLDHAAEARKITDDLLWIAIGALLVLFGVVILLATFSSRVAGAIGRLGEWRGVTGRLARENAVRNPRRTAATASALVIGLALVTLVAIFGSSTKASVDEAVDRNVKADVVLKARQFAGFSPEVAQRVADLPGVEVVSPFQFRKVRIHNVVETVASAQADGLAATVDLDMVAGSIRGLEPDGLLVEEQAARDYGVGVGDSLVIQMSKGFFPLRVAGIYREPDFTGGFPVSFIVPRESYLQGFGTDEQDTLVYVGVRGDADRAAAQIRRQLHHDFPNIEVFTRDGYRSDQQEAIDRFLAVTVALLLLSEIIAVLGIVNTLALSVFERTHELGLLRAVGMSRIQVRKMIRGESVIIAVLGSVVGIAVGLLWGWVFVTALDGQGITELSIPVLQLVLFLAVAVLAGVIAAWFPARRASRLDVLAAIATE